MSSFTPRDLEGEPLLLPEVVLLPDGPAREHGAIVRGGVFAEVGPAAELLAAHPHRRVVRMPGMLLMPGFVDAHHHLTQSFGKALAFGEPSEIFRRLWVPLERGLDERTAALAVKLSALEWLRGGFTTVADAGTRAPVDVSVVAEAIREVGVRCVLGLTCNDLDDGQPIRSQSSVLRAAEAHLERWAGDQLIHPSLAVSIPEAATDAVLAGLSRLCAAAGAVFQTHVNEHLVAVERSLEARGLRPLEHLHRAGALGPQLLAAHATLLTPTELTVLRDSGAAISYNPIASAWKGNAIAPATMLAAFGIRFGIGTDGTRGDGFHLLAAAELAQRFGFGLASGDSSCGGGWTWLHHATAGAADAVGLGAVTGRICPGYAADFLLVDLDVPELCPSWDLTWELVRLANRDQIRCVVVGGQPRLWRGWPIDWDGRALVEQARKAGQEVVERAPITRIHPTAAEHRARSAGESR